MRNALGCAPSGIKPARGKAYVVLFACGANPLRLGETPAARQAPWLP